MAIFGVLCATFFSGYITIPYASIHTSLQAAAQISKQLGHFIELLLGKK
jgi:hypothetical protein